MKRAMLTGLAALAVAGFAAGCGPAAAGSGAGASPGNSSPAAPAAATWHSGGSYTGPVPPGDPIPAPRGGWQLPLFTSPQGYKVVNTLKFGVPLHFGIPNRMHDCFSAYNYKFDLPPGQEMIPFEIQIHNLTGQSSPGIWPGMSATDSAGNSIDITNYGSMLWANGDCASDVSHILPSGGSDAVFGFIGPTTPSRLEGASVTASEDGSSAPSHSVQLQRVLPRIANSWLIAHS